MVAGVLAFVGVLNVVAGLEPTKGRSGFCDTEGTVVGGFFGRIGFLTEVLDLTATSVDSATDGKSLLSTVTVGLLLCEQMTVLCWSLADGISTKSSGVEVFAATGRNSALNGLRFPLHSATVFTVSVIASPQHGSMISPDKSKSSMPLPPPPTVPPPEAKSSSGGTKVARRLSITSLSGCSRRLLSAALRSSDRDFGRTDAVARVDLDLDFGAGPPSLATLPPRPDDKDDAADERFE
jgi:hypothetical protein